MSDEIDIEEHDILENPLLRNLFPDLSVVKKEITDYGDDAILENKQCETIETSKNEIEETASSNDIICETSDTPEKKYYRNKIILGSKPNAGHLATGKFNENVIKIPKIVLQDLKLYLETNRRYCKDCLILFPRISCLHLHKKQIHKKIAVYKKKESFNKITKIKSKIKCRKCDISFSNMGNLQRHNRNKHGIYILTQSKSNQKPIGIVKGRSYHRCDTNENDNVDSLKLILNRVEKNIAKKDTNKQLFSARNIILSTFNQCHICGTCFSNKSNMYRHYQNIHNKKLTSQKTPLKNKLSYQRSKYNEKNKLNRDYGNTFKDLNHHQSLKHNLRHTKATITKNKEIEHKKDELFVKGNVDQNKCETQKFKLDFNKCSICNKSNSSFDKLITHYKDIHQIKINNNKKKANDKRKRSINKCIMEQETDKTCFHCQKKFANAQSLIEHVYEHLTPNSFKSIKDTRTKGNNSIKPSKSNNFDVVDFDGDNQLEKECDDPEEQNDVESEESFQTQDTITDHLTELSSNDNFNVNNQEISDYEEDLHENSNDRKNVKEKVYICPICSYCLPTLKSFHRHMNVKHNTKTASCVVRNVFNPQCKYCPSKSVSAKSHNIHIANYHKNILFRNINNKVAYALKSVLYKCLKCDTHFISANIAKDHKGHMEMLINWKCYYCQRIFKEMDAELHLKQHHLTTKHVTYEIDDKTVLSFLFKCTKCAIHFTEIGYFMHYGQCEAGISSAKYCEHCDILIDDVEFQKHETIHREGKTENNFTIITCEVISNETVSEKGIVKRKHEENIIEMATKKRLYEQVNCLTYCPTCHCFLTHRGLSHKTHLESRCADILKYICDICGLVLTNKSIRGHRNDHKNNKTLCIQDYKFYDLKGNLIDPPIPEYPSCKICQVHFKNKKEVRLHICNEIKYLLCTICNLKMHESAHKLHMSFHSYSKTNDKVIKLSVNDINQVDGKVEHDETLHKDLLPLGVKSPTVFSTQDGHNNKFCDIGILFSCKYCSFTFEIYDKLVEHCQNHFLTSKDKSKEQEYNVCDICSCQFDITSLNNHKLFHLKNLQFKVLYIDLSYFTTDNKVWRNHVFGTLNTNIANQITSESIYQFEHRVRLEIYQKGPSELTIYKCNLCGNFIDPIIIYKHTECKFLKCKKYPCSFCGLPFLTLEYLKKHEEIHKNKPQIDSKSYRVVLMNQNEDKHYNKSVFLNNIFILYQCRNCHIILETKNREHTCEKNEHAKCSSCHLLFNKSEIDAHYEKHKNIKTYISKNMKVILFGQKENSEKEYERTQFDGIVYDYTLYQCKTCQICVKNDFSITKHVCMFDDINRVNCHLCGFYFGASTILDHIKMHKLEAEFMKENFNVIGFDLSKDKHGIKKHEQFGKMHIDKQSTDADKPISDNTCVKAKETETDSFDVVTIFKCSTCDLHYLNKTELKKHGKNCHTRNKLSKQNCTKCDLIFTPADLFSHLLNHHGNKNKLYKYYIANVDGEVDERTPAYKCSNCDIHFLNEAKAHIHFSECVRSKKCYETVKCVKCQLVFEAASFNSEMHSDNCINNYYIITLLKELLVGQSNI